MRLKIDRYGILDTFTGEILPYKPKGKHSDKIIYALYFPSGKTVLDFFIRNMSSTNIVEISHPEDIYHSLNICKATYHNKIGELIKDDMCVRLSNTKFMVNPARYLKGSRRIYDKISSFYQTAKDKTNNNSGKKMTIKTFSLEKNKDVVYE